jgi:hypothetical protein
MPLSTEPIGSIPRPADLLAAMSAYAGGKISRDQLRAGEQPPCATRSRSLSIRARPSSRTASRPSPALPRIHYPGSTILPRAASRLLLLPNLSRFHSGATSGRHGCGLRIDLPNQAELRGHPDFRQDEGPVGDRGQSAKRRKVRDGARYRASPFQQGLRSYAF